jgi:tetrahydromethanopterin S-methyltransferase subunit F
MEPQTDQVTKVTSKQPLLSREQKYFIGSVFTATGIVLFILSIMLLISLLLATSFKFSILLEMISAGYILSSIAIALLTTGIIGFAVGTVLTNK